MNQICKRDIQIKPIVVTPTLSVVFASFLSLTQYLEVTLVIQTNKLHGIQFALFVSWSYFSVTIKRISLYSTRAGAALKKSSTRSLK